MADETIQIAEAGKLPDGTTRIPFQVKLEPVEGQKMYETYHGVYITCSYTLNVVCERGGFKKTLSQKIEFLVEIQNQKSFPNVEKVLEIMPDNVDNIKKSDKDVPDFRMTVKLPSTNCLITEALHGSVCGYFLSIIFFWFVTMEA